MFRILFLVYSQMSPSLVIILNSKWHIVINEVWIKGKALFTFKYDWNELYQLGINRGFKGTGLTVESLK